MNKRSMRMLGFNKIKQQLMRETSSCLSRKLVNALFPVQQSQEAVSYTHLTLPTNREV